MSATCSCIYMYSWHVYVAASVVCAYIMVVYLYVYALFMCIIMVYSTRALYVRTCMYNHAYVVLMRTHMYMII